MKQFAEKLDHKDIYACDVGYPAFTTGIDTGSIAVNKSGCEVSPIMDPLKAGLDSPEVDFEHLMEFERVSPDEQNSKEKKLANREDLLKERVASLLRYMVLLHTHNQISDASGNELLSESVQKGLTENKAAWATQLVQKNQRLQNAKKEENKDADDKRLSLSQKWCDLAPEQPELGPISDKKYLEQFARDEIRQIWKKCKQNHADRDSTTLAQSCLADLVKSEYLQRATAIQDLSQTCKLDLMKKAAKIRDILENSANLADIKDEYVLKRACIYIHLAAITKDVAYLVELIHDLLKLREGWMAWQDPSEVSFILFEHFSLFQQTFQIEDFEAMAQEQLINTYLKENHKKVAQETRNVYIENATRKFYGVKDSSGIQANKKNERGEEDRKKFITLRNQHWINYICIIIKQRIVASITEIKDAKPSALILHKNFSVSKPGKLIEIVTKCSQTLEKEYDEIRRGLPKKALTTLASQYALCYSTLSSLVYTNLFAAKRDGLHIDLFIEQYKYWKEQSQGSICEKLVLTESIQDQLAKSPFCLDTESLDAYIMKNDANEPSFDVQSLDLTDAKATAKTILEMGILNESTADFKDHLLQLLQRFLNKDSLSGRMQSLHCVILALFTRKECLKCPQVVGSVMELLNSGAQSLDKQVIGDMVRLILAARVCKLLQPVELKKEDQPSPDSPEALIMQSDLLSGGLEPHLYYLFEEKELKSMLKHVKCSQVTDITTLLEEALKRKTENLGNEVLTDHDRLLKQIIGEIEAEEGEPDMINMLITGLQMHMRSKPNLTYSRIGGESGIRLTRIAFAIMIKFAGLTDDLQQILSELDYASISLPEEGDPSREQAILETLQVDQSFEKILNYWIVASKMRIWLNGKKQSLISRLTNENQNEEELNTAFAAADTQMDAIVDKIQKKGAFLLALAQPASFKQALSTQSVDMESQFSKKLSYAPEMQDEDHEKEWKKKVTEWRSDLQELGIFKNRNETLKQIRSAGTTSILACLQSPIQLDQIVHQVQTTSQNAIRRLSAFKLLSQLFEASPDRLSPLLADVFTALQDGKQSRKIIHYTEGIKGCGLLLEEKIQACVFNILHKITLSMKVLKAKHENEKTEKLLPMLRALEWKFSGRDFSELVDRLPIFQILSNGSKSFVEILHQDRFEQHKLTVFKEVFFSIAARITDKEAVTTMQLKPQGSTQIPEISRRQSILSQTLSEQILAQAYYEIFRSFNQIVEFHTQCVNHGKMLGPKSNDVRVVALILDDQGTENIQMTKQDREKYDDNRNLIFAHLFLPRNGGQQALTRLQDLLSMLQLHVSVALANQQPQQMLLSLATPYHLQILLKLLLILLPSEKLRIIKILDGLQTNKLPQELFDDAARPLLLKQEEGDMPELLLAKHFTSSYAKFLYETAAKIRLYRGLNKHIKPKNDTEIEPYHQVSRQLLRLAIKFEDRTKLTSGFNEVMKHLADVSEAEQSLLFEIVDASISWIQQGDSVVYTDKDYLSMIKAYDNEPMEVQLNKNLLIAEYQNRGMQVYSRTECLTKNVHMEQMVRVPLAEEKFEIYQETLYALVADLSKAGITELTKVSILKYLLMQDLNALSAEVSSKLLEYLTDRVNQPQDSLRELVVKLDQQSSNQNLNHWSGYLDAKLQARDLEVCLMLIWNQSLGLDLEKPIVEKEEESKVTSTNETKKEEDTCIVEEKEEIKEQEQLFVSIKPNLVRNYYKKTRDYQKLSAFSMKDDRQKLLAQIKELMPKTQSENSQDPLLVLVRALIALLSDKHERESAQHSISVLFADAIRDSSQTIKQRRFNFLLQRLAIIVDRKIKDHDVTKLKQILGNNENDFGSNELIMQMDYFIEGKSQPFTLKHQTESSYAIKQGRKKIQPEQKEDKLRNCNIKMILEKRQKSFLQNLTHVTASMLVTKLSERLYFEMHHWNSAVNEDQMNFLLRLFNEYNLNKKSQRKFANWHNQPNGFNGATMHKIWSSFASSNSKDCVKNTIEQQTSRFKLDQKTQLFTYVQEQPSAGKFSRDCEHSLNSNNVKVIQNLTLWLAKSPELALGHAVQLTDCLLLHFHKTLMLSEQSQSEDLVRMRSKSLAVIFNFFETLANQSNQSEAQKSVFEQIWQLKSLQCFIKHLPNEVNKIKNLYEYKFAEIALKVKSVLPQVDCKLADSLLSFKSLLNKGLDFDVQAFKKALETAKEKTVSMSIDSKQTPKLNEKWQEINLPQTDEMLSMLDIKMKLTNGVDTPLAMCTYAAISEAPEFNETTKIARFHTHEKDSCIKWKSKPSKLFVLYPIDRNFVLQLHCFENRTAEQPRDTSFKFIDRLDDPKFNPTTIFENNNFANTQNLGVGAFNKNKAEFYEPVTQRKSNGKSWINKEKKLCVLPASETIKHFSNVCTINFSQAIKTKFGLPNSKSSFYLVLTESGRLYVSSVNWFSDASTPKHDPKIFEFPLVDSGIGPIECISTKVCSEYGHFTIATKDGSVYMHKNADQKLHKLISAQDQLEDGQSIEAVEEICELNVNGDRYTITLVRATTNKGNQIVLSMSNFAHVKTLGRKVDDKKPFNKLNVLDYDYEMIQFTQMSANRKVAAALDQYGEIWILAGEEDRNTGLTMGFDFEQNSKKRQIQRPICTNHMRKANKVAMRLECCEQFMVVLAEDIATQARGIHITKGKVKQDGVNDYALKMRKWFDELVKTMLGDTKGQFEICQLQSPNDSSSYNPSWLHVLCKPNWEALETKLSIDFIPAFENVPPPTQEKDLMDPKLRNNLLKEVNQTFKELAQSAQSNKDFKAIDKYIQRKQNTLLKFSNRHVKFDHDETTHQFAKQFFEVQQALVDTVFLIGQIQEDPLKDKISEQLVILQDYNKMINLTDSNLLDRIRFKQFLHFKSFTGGRKDVYLNRIAANEFKSQQRHEKASEVFTLFTQLMYNYKQKFHKLDINTKEPFETHMTFERSYDCGGPMRDTITSICDELMSDVLPLLRPTANNQSNLEPQTDCYQLNERSKEPYNLRKLAFLGYFLGWSLCTIGSLNLELPTAFWNRLCGGLDYIYTIEDVRSQDVLLANHLDRIREASEEQTEEYFAAVYGDCTFILETGHQDRIVELCAQGSSKSLTKHNAEEYIRLYLENYSRQDDLQFRSLYQSFEFVATRKVLSQLKPSVAQRRICSSAQIDVASFKASTIMQFQNQQNKEKNKATTEMFWQMIEEISNEDRQRILKFMCGRSRLQPGVTQTFDWKDTGDGRLPIGHTCGNSMDIPEYSSVEVMKKMVLIAARFCGEIDDDAEYMEQDDSDGDEDYANAGLQMEGLRMENNETNQDDDKLPEGLAVQPLQLTESIIQMKDIHVTDNGVLVANQSQEQDNEMPVSAEAQEAMFDF